MNKNQFTDRAGRTWTLNFVTTDIALMRAHGVELNSLPSERVRQLIDMMGDAERLVAVGFMLCEKQAEKLGVTAQDFGSEIGGDELEALSAALYGAFVLFSPTAVRPTLWKLWEMSDSPEQPGETSDSKSGATDSAESSASIPAP